MSGKISTAPCGHIGEHITANYVQCLAGCDRVAPAAPAPPAQMPEFLANAAIAWRSGHVILGNELSLVERDSVVALYRLTYGAGAPLPLPNKSACLDGVAITGPNPLVCGTCGPIRRQ